jgi:hypothetical protein
LPPQDRIKLREGDDGYRHRNEDRADVRYGREDARNGPPKGGLTEALAQSANTGKNTHYRTGQYVESAESVRFERLFS